MEKITRFKMYKAGKQWLVAGATLLAVGVGTTVVASADSTATVSDDQQVTTATDASNVSGNSVVLTSGQSATDATATDTAAKTDTPVMTTDVTPKADTAAKADTPVATTDTKADEPITTPDATSKADTPVTATDASAKTDTSVTTTDTKATEPTTTPDATAKVDTTVTTPATTTTDTTVTKPAATTNATSTATKPVATTAAPAKTAKAAPIAATTDTTNVANDTNADTTAVASTPAAKVNAAAMSLPTIVDTNNNANAVDTNFNASDQVDHTAPLNVNLSLKTTQDENVIAAKDKIILHFDNPAAIDFSAVKLAAGGQEFTVTTDETNGDIILTANNDVTYTGTTPVTITFNPAIVTANQIAKMTAKYVRDDSTSQVLAVNNDTVTVIPQKSYDNLFQPNTIGSQSYTVNSTVKGTDGTTFVNNFYGKDAHSETYWFYRDQDGMLLNTAVWNSDLTNKRDVTLKVRTSAPIDQKTFKMSEILTDWTSAGFPSYTKIADPSEYQDLTFDADGMGFSVTFPTVAQGQQFYASYVVLTDDPSKAVTATSDLTGTIYQSVSDGKATDITPSVVHSSSNATFEYYGSADAGYYPKLITDQKKTIHVGDATFDPTTLIQNASDQIDGTKDLALKDKVKVIGWDAANQKTPGTYKVTYTLTNSLGLTSQQTSVITVLADETAPATPEKPMPEVPGAGVNDLTKTVSRTINYVYADGTTAKPSITQNVKFTRTAVVDTVTHTVVSYTDWVVDGSDQYPAVVTVPIDGYTASLDTVAAATANVAGNADPVNVVYKAKIITVTPDQPNPDVPGAGVDDLNKTVSRTINYVYADGTTAKPSITQEVKFTRTATVNLATHEVSYTDWAAEGDGQYPAVVTVPIDGYTASLDTVAAATADVAGNADPVNVVYKDKVITVTPDQPNPDVPGAGVDDLNKTVSRTINYVYADGTTAKPSITQEVKFTRTATVNLATHEVSYTDWAAEGDGQYPEVVTVPMDGYEASVDSVPAATADMAGDAAPVNVVYTKILTSSAVVPNEPVYKSSSAVVPNEPVYPSSSAVVPNEPVYKSSSAVVPNEPAPVTPSQSSNGSSATPSNSGSATPSTSGSVAPSSSAMPSNSSSVVPSSSASSISSVPSSLASSSVVTSSVATSSNTSLLVSSNVVANKQTVASVANKTVAKQTLTAVKNAQVVKSADLPETAASNDSVWETVAGLVSTTLVMLGLSLRKRH